MSDSGIAALGIGVILAGIVIILIPAIFFCLTLQNTLNKVKVQNRTMSPGQVWLLLIPFFNIVWQFMVVTKMASSLHNEFVSRNIQEEPEPGKNLGLAFCICGVLSIIPVIGFIISLAALICFIIYWVKIAGYSGKLDLPYEAMNPQSGYQGNQYANTSYNQNYPPNAQPDAYNSNPNEPQNRG